MQTPVYLPFNPYHIWLIHLGFAGGIALTVYFQHAKLTDAEPQVRRRASIKMWVATLLFILLSCPGVFVVAYIQLLLLGKGIFFP